MGKKNVVKRFGIASLCLGVAFCAVGGVAANVAFAEEAGEPAQNTVQTTDLVHTDATVSITEEMATLPRTNPTSTAFTGLRISSDEAYKATFKTVFEGNMEIKFRFPETYTNGLYGDFTFRFTDVTDESNYFEVTYYVENEYYFTTTPYVQWGDEVRMTPDNMNAAWHNTLQSGKMNYKFAPCFLTKAHDTLSAHNDRMGVLSLVWLSEKLTVSVNTVSRSDSSSGYTLQPLAVFDDTYDTSASNNGFVAGKAGAVDCGLPTMNFENGYTISVSSSFEDERTTDHGTDVFFSSIVADNAYNFSNAEMTKNKQMEAFENGFEFLPESVDLPTEAGKVFLGYKNAAGKLFGLGSLVKKDATYEPFVVSYDTLSGASVRVDVEGGRSGIRFQTLFNPTEYEAFKGYIQSFGTIITYTDTLTSVDKDFIIENYQSESTFAQVKNTKGTFRYTDKDGNTYVSYSMALVNIKDYTRAYSARGYLVIEYVDGATITVYTDYNAAENSRSIAEVANLMKTENAEKYAEMSPEQQAVIDDYAAAYGVTETPDTPEEPEEPEAPEVPEAPEEPEE